MVVTNLKQPSTASASPIGAAGGDLTGSEYPNPTIGAEKVTEAKLTAAIRAKLALAASSLQNVARSITDALLEKPVIVGAVKANGEIEVGAANFAVEKIGTSKYKITLTAELPTVGVIIPIVHDPTLVASDTIHVLTAPSKTVFEILIGLGSTGAEVEKPFYFMIKAS